jgi:hypothetical protein
MKGSGYIARGVTRKQHSWLKHGKPRNDTELKELTVAQCEQMAPQLIGKPIRAEHQTSNFGVITGSRFNANGKGDWEIDFEITGGDLSARMLENMLKSSATQGLSLTHAQAPDGTIVGEPHEVSLCETPARVGCYITKFNNTVYNADDHPTYSSQSRGFDLIEASLFGNHKKKKMDTSADGKGTKGEQQQQQGNNGDAMDTSGGPQDSVAVMKAIFDKNKTNPDFVKFTELMAKTKQESDAKTAMLVNKMSAEQKALTRKLMESQEGAAKAMELNNIMIEKVLEQRQDPKGKEALQAHKDEWKKDPKYREAVSNFATSKAGQELLVSASLGVARNAYPQQEAPPSQQQQQVKQESSPVDPVWAAAAQAFFKEDVKVPQQNQVVSVEASFGRGGGGGGAQPRGPQTKEEVEAYFRNYQSNQCAQWVDTPDDITDTFANFEDQKNPYVVTASLWKENATKAERASKKRKLDYSSSSSMDGGNMAAPLDVFD